MYGNICNMTKQEIEPFVGKFVELTCSYDVDRKGKPTQFMIACGYIRSLEDKYLEFEDNDGYFYLSRLAKVWNIKDMGTRRTLQEWKEEQQRIAEKEAKKREKKAGRVE
jgi:DNA-dependent RNA polymerase auxiliary subunit epsilon